MKIIFVSVPYCVFFSPNLHDKLLNMATLHQQPANIQALYGNKRTLHHPKLLEHKYQQDRTFAHRQSESFLAKQQLRKQGDNFVTTALNEDKSTCEKYGFKKRIIPDTPRDHM
jgi:hypothetical protein